MQNPNQEHSIEHIQKENNNQFQNNMSENNDTQVSDLLKEINSINQEALRVYQHINVRTPLLWEKINNTHPVQRKELIRALDIIELISF